MGFNSAFKALNITFNHVYILNIGVKLCELKTYEVQHF